MKINIQLYLCFILVFVVNYAFSQNVHVDDFDNGSIANFPIDWDKRGDQAMKEYLVAKDTTGNKNLCVSFLNSNIFILKQLKVDLVEYPYLNWSWRANDLPTDGDESVKKYCDAAACIAIVLKLLKFRPRSIKYTWSTTLDIEVGTKSPYAFWPSRSDIIVLESGNDELGNW